MVNENHVHVVKTVRRYVSVVNEKVAPKKVSTQAAPIWQALEQTGVQSFDYPDAPRKDLHRLFAGAPKMVLDIGCGSGAVGLGIKQSFDSVVVWGCELDARAATLATTRLDRVITEPMRQWPAQEVKALADFDTVLLLDVLEHMYNPWAEMQFLAQHIHPHAQVIVSLPNVGHKSVMNALAQGDWPYASVGILDITHLRFFTEKNMLALFEQTGFEVMDKQYLTYRPVQQIEQFPVEVNFGAWRLQVRDWAHWMQLNSIQLGFRLKKRS